MINRVHLLSVSFLCTAVLLVGCGPSKTSTDVNDRYGAFNHLEQELASLKSTLAPESSYTGNYDPVEDQLGEACSMLAKNENIPEELRPQLKELVTLERYLHEVYNSPEASKENLMAVVYEMEAIIENVKTAGL